MPNRLRSSNRRPKIMTRHTVATTPVITIVPSDDGMVAWVIESEIQHHLKPRSSK